jgi:hypothetical protein
MKELRLVKVAVQPFFILDGGGEDIVEIEHPVTIIPANEWKTYSSERFQREIEEWQKKINEEN